MLLARSLKIPVSSIVHAIFIPIYTHQMNGKQSKCNKQVKMCTYMEVEKICLTSRLIALIYIVSVRKCKKVMYDLLKSK